MVEVLGRSTRHSRKAKFITESKVPSFTFATANLAVGLPLAENGKLPSPHNIIKTSKCLSFFTWWRLLEGCTRHSRKAKFITESKVPSFTFATANLAVGLPLAENGKLPSPHNNIKICFICDFATLIRLFLYAHLNFSHILATKSKKRATEVFSVAVFLFKFALTVRTRTSSAKPRKYRRFGRVRISFDRHSRKDFSEKKQSLKNIRRRKTTDKRKICDATDCNLLDSLSCATLFSKIFSVYGGKILKSPLSSEPILSDTTWYSINSLTIINN